MKYIDIKMNKIDFIRINRISPRYRVNSTVCPHRHDDMEMHLIIHGHGEMEVGNKTFPVSENSLIISFPEDTHRLILTGNSPYILQYTVFFELTGGHSEFSAMLRRRFRCGIINDKTALLFPEVERLWNSDNELLRQAAEHLLMSFLLGVTAAGDAPVVHPEVEKARAYMCCRVAEKLSLSQVSRHVGLEKSYFCRLFKQTTGETPMRFYLKQKIEFSKELLDAGRRNAEVAGTVGFSDEFHFSRRFKKITGMTPRQYRSRKFTNQGIACRSNG